MNTENRPGKVRCSWIPALRHCVPAAGMTRAVWWAAVGTTDDRRRGLRRRHPRRRPRATTHLDRFADGSGGFYDTATDAERLSRRPRDPADSATPSGWFTSAGLLLGVGALSGEARYRSAAERSLAAASALGVQAPRAAGWGLAVAEAMVDGPREVAIVGTAPESEPLLRTAWLGTAPGLLVAPGRPGQDRPPLLRDRIPGGGASAYVCRGFVCEAPVSDPEELTPLVSV